ncbi:MAG: carboxypeptidase regulatory-like domain-containing protein, partial [Acidobacteria bacterium]|nr:carboxypeptidase regulatory-like domain-containing protein [Acidobacteriota bacterium]
MVIRAISFLCGAVLLGVSLLWGQVTTGSILGRVQDQTGAVVPGVSVTARNLETGLTRTVVTNERGRYQILSLPPGNYEVEAEMAGFQKAIRRGIELTVGREAVVNLSQSVGEVTEQVVVVGEAPLVETTRAEMAGLVSQQQIQDLPLNGRSLDQLVYLEPGIIPTKTQ